ncbi:MAG: hypothetical protein JSS63_02325 [Bacteroidetes bacterium]|nr:hypothetical protein [Bacteroidota bacterium]
MKKNISRKLKGKKIIIYSEKVYEAEIQSDGSLICEPESEEIKKIVCLNNGLEYTEKDFKEIRW